MTPSPPGRYSESPASRLYNGKKKNETFKIENEKTNKILKFYCSEAFGVANILVRQKKGGRKRQRETQRDEWKKQFD